MDQELEKLRTRWRRWLGQMLRSDRYNLVDLLDSNYQGWCNRVLSDHNFKIDSDMNDKWHRAISVATIVELQRLDCLVLEETE